MLRDVVLTNDKERKLHYLKRTYEWFVQQQTAVGILSATAQEKEADFMNPQQVKAREQQKALDVEKKRVEFQDDEKHE